MKYLVLVLLLVACGYDPSDPNAGCADTGYYTNGEVWWVAPPNSFCIGGCPEGEISWEACLPSGATLGTMPPEVVTMHKWAMVAPPLYRE